MRGASTSDTLSPTPPVECLSTRGTPRSARANRSPLSSIASVSAAVSSRSRPRMKQAMRKAAVAADSSSTEALWKASNAAVDLGEFNDAERQSFYARAETLGRLAVKSNPNSSEAHFALAKALGRVALSKGKRDKVKYAGVVH